MLFRQFAGGRDKRVEKSDDLFRIIERRRIEKLANFRGPPSHDLPQQFPALLGEREPGHPAVELAVLTLHEAPADQPVADAGHRRWVHLQRSCEVDTSLWSTAREHHEEPVLREREVGIEGYQGPRGDSDQDATQGRDGVGEVVPVARSSRRNRYPGRLVIYVCAGGDR